MTLRFFYIFVFAGLRLSAQGGIVEGKVVASTNGQPVRKAMVVMQPARVAQGAVQRGTEIYASESDNNGNFVFKEVVPGDYQVAARKQRYDVVSPDRYADTTDVPQFTVKNGQRTTGILIKLTPLGAIMGHVFDADGDPVRGANVEALQYGYVRGQQELQTRRNAQTNDRGEYRVFDLFPGQYVLRVSKPDRGIAIGGEIRGLQLQFAFAQTYFGGTTEATRAGSLDLAAGGELRGVDIRMDRQGLFSIRGRLPEAPGQPPGRGVGISAQRRPASGGFGGGMTQIRNDQYEISNLVPGSYSVTARLNVSNAGRGGAGNVTAQLVARRFVEIVNRDVDGVDLTFEPPLEISGVMKTTGSVAIGLANQRIDLQPVEPGSPQFSGQVAADGTFTIHNVVPDVYRIRINSPGNAYATSVKLGDRELAGRELDLRDGRVGTLTVVVSRDSGRIDGTVTGDDGAPAAQVNVTLVPDQSRPDWSDRFRNVLTDSQGRFSFPNVIPEHYQVFAWKDAPRGAPQDAGFRKPFEKLAVPVDVEVNKTVNLQLKPITTQAQQGVNQ